MVLADTRCCQVDRLVAVPRFIVVTLTLLTVRVTDVVRVLLLKLFIVNVILPCELTFPEAKRLIKCETDSFEEQTKLQSSIMLQMVLILERSVQCLHTGGEVLA